MPPPLTNPPTHQEQLRLRETMRECEKYIVKGLLRFEELTGITVHSINLVRWPGGGYCPTISLGPAVAPPACPAPPPASGSAS